MLILNKEDLEFVTLLHCLLGHPVTIKCVQKTTFENCFNCILEYWIYCRKGGTTQSKSVDLTAEQMQRELGLGVCTGQLFCLIKITLKGVFAKEDRALLKLRFSGIDMKDIKSFIKKFKANITICIRKIIFLGVNDWRHGVSRNGTIFLFS